MLILVVDDDADIEVLFGRDSGAISALAASRWSLRSLPHGAGAVRRWATLLILALPT